MIGGFNYGTEIKVKRYWNGFDGDFILRKAGKKKKGLYIKKKKKIHHKKWNIPDRTVF